MTVSGEMAMGAAEHQPVEAGRRAVAATVARAIDDVVQHPVLVVGSLPPYGRDLDLLATPADVPRIEAWLRSAGYVPWRHTWARLGVNEPYAVELSSLARWATSRDDGSALFTDADPVVGHRHLVRPGSAATILLAARGTVTRRGTLHAKARRRVDEALRRDPDAWRRAEELAPELGMSGAVRLLRQAHGHPGPLAWPTRVRGVLQVLQARGPLSARVQVMAGARPRRLRPALVSFSGLDGSGKSTQVAQLRDNLRAIGVTADVQWAGFRSARKVRALLPVLDRTREDDPPRDPLVPSLLRCSDAGRTAWVYVVVAVNAVHLWRLVLRRRRGAAVLIFDRFTPDTTVKIDLHFLRSRRIDTRRATRFFALISPKPDIGFLVAVSPEIAYQRRQEQTPEELTSMSELYEEQVDRYGLRLLDGTQPRDRLAAAVALEAWRELR